jgi:uncharacterized membrane protein YuzA (DUF378 family)
MYGQSSIEPIAAVLGAFAVIFHQFYLCFGFCGRRYDLCGGRSNSKTQQDNNTASHDGIRWGFIVMMVLDVALW